MKSFNELPMEVKEQIRETLKAYNEVNVWFEYGEYHVMPGACLKASYGADHKVIGTYKAKEVFTEAQRIENYINEFNSYPMQYKGKRDYGIMQKMQKDRQIVDLPNGKWGIAIWQGKLNENGDFELTEKKVF